MHDLLYVCMYQQHTCAFVTSVVIHSTCIRWDIYTCYCMRPMFSVWEYIYLVVAYIDLCHIDCASIAHIHYEYWYIIHTHVCRPVCGIRNSTLIINLPGSTKGSKVKSFLLLMQSRYVGLF